MAIERTNPRRWFVATQILSYFLLGACVTRSETDESLAKTTLSQEVAAKGWIVFSSRSASGDWDLMVSRPDGSRLRNITNTPKYHEYAPQFSQDGRRLLYRRTPIENKIKGNSYGRQGSVIISQSDGTKPEPLAGEGEYPWANWTPDGEKIAYLSVQGIFQVDLATRKELLHLPRKGFFQQLTCSPDGKSACGVSNAFGTGWSIAIMDLKSGDSRAVSRVDCCTPDWFPNGESLIFSSRPPGQPGNRGQGWTQLWQTSADGKSRSLVYGEDGRHIYGGNVSPDGRYVVFCGNAEEDGDPEHGGAPMGIIRLADAPIITGKSNDLRKLHPNARSGPVLSLIVGWEPCWTYSELPGHVAADANQAVERQANALDPISSARSELCAELGGKGWIAFSAESQDGDWDLFLGRPDGSERHAITRTREFNEAGARFSPDGYRLLYYRMPKADSVDNNTYGNFDLILADANGKNPVDFGRACPWATWAPDGKELACVTPHDIQIVNVASRRVVRKLPRQGIMRQLVWSPNGKAFVGTANGLGEYWNIGCISADDTKIQPIGESERYNCTPDWHPDGEHILYARGGIPNHADHAQLWVASASGKNKQMLFAESDRNIYGAATSPDAKYLLFTRSVADLGAVGKSQTTMAVARWGESPMLGGQNAELQKQFPDVHPGVWLDLGPGWEPHWTYSEAPGTN